MGFFQNIGLATGRDMNFAQEQAQTQADIDYKRQQIDSSRMQNMMQQRSMQQEQERQQSRQQLGQQIADMQKGDQDGVEDPAKASQMFQRAALSAFAQGDISGAQQLRQLGKDALEDAQQKKADVQEKISSAKEDLAKKAIAFAQMPTPEGQEAVKKAAVAAGVNPMDMPPPNSPQFAQWAKQQETASMSSVQQLKAQETAREFNVKQQETSSHNRATETAHQDSLALTASNQANAKATRDQTRVSALSMQEERLAMAHDRADEAKIKTLNGSVDRATKTNFNDKNTLNQALNALSLGTNAGDQQVRQLLTSAISSAKGRATSQFYKDGARLGSFIERISDTLSKLTSGTYSEETRKQLTESVHSMIDLNDAGITNVLAKARAQAKLKGIDPEQIYTPGDFNDKREEDVGRAPSPKGGASGKLSPSPAGAPAAPVTQTLNGVDYFQKDGKWFRK